MICFAVEPDLHHSMLLILSICDIYIQLYYYYYALVDSNVIHTVEPLYKRDLSKTISSPNHTVQLCTDLPLN